MTSHNEHRNPAKPGSLLRVAWYDETVDTSYPDYDDGWRPSGALVFSKLEHIRDINFAGSHIPFGTKGLLVVDAKPYTNFQCLWYQVLYKEQLFWIYSGDTVVEKQEAK